MATVQILAGLGRLHKLVIPLEDDEQELRCVYASDQVSDFILNHLPALPSSHGTEINPAQELDALLAEYACGLPVEAGKDIKAFAPRAFDPLEGGIWYLKTSDLRIFGWFPHPDVFIAVYADTFENVKGKNLYEGRRNQAIHFRNSLDLDEPKFIPGDDPHAVLSNCVIST
jgi:hypothetical protein